MNPIQLIIAVAVGIVTASVCYRIFRDFSTFGGGSLPIALCGGILAVIGVMNLGDRLIALTIPWAALGVTFCLLFIFSFCARLFRARCPGGGKKSKSAKPSSKSSSSMNSLARRSDATATARETLATNEYSIGNLLPPLEGE